MLNTFNLRSNQKHWAILFTCLLISLCFMANAQTKLSQQKLVAFDGAAEDFFGFSLAISNDIALVGAFKSDDEIAGIDSGSAYVFTRTKNGWLQQAELTAKEGAASDTLGGNVALFQETAVLGASRHDNNGEDSGAAYIFKRTGSIWSEHSILLANDGAKGDAFGQAIAISDNTIVIGAPRDDDKGKDSGSVYVFTRKGTTWSQQAKLTAPDGAAGDVFGISVALANDTILIGADLHDEKATNAGAVYVFTRSGTSWRQQAKLVAADAAETDLFGVRVALSGDTALISARRDDDEIMGVDAGSAYVFVRTGTTWQQQAKLTAPDGASDDRFGRSVAISGDTALISAMHQDDKGANSGSAYIFSRTAGIWSHQTNLTAEDGAPGDVFGFSVALSNNTALIGATGNDDKGNESGAAYMFEIKAN
tara:strand:- start:3433 stop:4698 length:1266 start_codon:yes stop_codon:yes gene_type:complete